MEEETNTIIKKIEICPICINTDGTYFTKCNHGYCIDCLCKIDKCALCRSPIKHNELGDKIYNHYKKLNINKKKTNNNEIISVSELSNGGRIEVRSDPRSPTGITTHIYIRVNLPEVSNNNRQINKNNRQINTNNISNNNTNNKQINRNNRNENKNLRRINNHITKSNFR